MNPVLAFLWKYIAGPIMADARNAETAVWNGVTAHTGYNIYNTLAWGILAVVIILLIRKKFNEKDIQLNTSTAINTIPFIILGGILRFLEDAAVIPLILRPLAITPIIYLVITGLFLSSIYISSIIAKKKGYERDKVLNWIGLSLLAPFVIVSAVSLLGAENISVLITSVILTALLTGIYYIVTRRTDYSDKEYLLVALSQFFGGSVSMISLSYGYTQKQLLTQLFTSIFGDPGVLVLKMSLAGLSIYLIEHDIEEEELKALALIVLYSIGLGTGIRVLLRVALGI